MKHSVDVGMLY